MISSKIKNLDKINQFILIFICFFSSSALCDENQVIKSIEKEWNQTLTLEGKFLQKFDDKIFTGSFFIEKPYKSNFAYHDKQQNIITSQGGMNPAPLSK